MVESHFHLQWAMLTDTMTYRQLQQLLPIWRAMRGVSDSALNLFLKLWKTQCWEKQMISLVKEVAQQHILNS